ncbi:hypothetical protein AMB3_3636 [plant metagenome]|uniref:A-factor biosynthesis hotdog domain-containing protein n=1 Tax=plant metagenome TaxID=1297885 RepID=A0A484P3X7_9ZZZZ
MPRAFKQFSEHPNLLPYEELLSILLRSDDAPVPEIAGRKLIAGQGLDDMQVSHAWYIGVSRGLIQEFSHWRAARKVRYADRSLCHKQRPENILISAPEKNADDSYTSELLLHERNELMLDHLTGQHIQGMVLAEACRQMFLAVTEHYFLDDCPSSKRYFVINLMNVRYQSFAFPLPTQIHYRVIERKQPKPDRIFIHADMDVHQSGQPVAGMEVQFTVFDDGYLSKRESKLAAQAVGNYVDFLRDELRKSAPDEIFQLSSLFAASGASPNEAPRLVTSSADPISEEVSPASVPLPQ